MQQAGKKVPCQPRRVLTNFNCMKSFFPMLALWCFVQSAYGQDKIPVFRSGTEGHQSYRIPALLALPGGDLLAFCEGRVNNAGDFGDINIVMKRSSDGGRNWSALQVIVDAGALQAGNPAPVVDLTDLRFPGGRIFLFYNTGNNHENEVRNGRGLREVWYKTSTDNGNTWSEAVNITTQVHRPQQPAANPAYNFREDWRSYANTPGHALQFTTGVYRGRLFVAANHSAGPPQPQFTDYAAHGFYTDDHGATFRLSATVTIPGSNESTAAALGNGRLMMNSRNQRGDIRARIVSISSNGGESWDTSYFDRQLMDPVNQGSLLNIGQRRGKAVLAFSNTADSTRRDRLTLRISMDEGRSWNKAWVIDSAAAGYKGAYTAYSDLVRLNKKHIGILYERNGYTEIVFTVKRWR